MKMNIRLALLAGCVAAVAGIPDAQAGFQWTAPIGVPATATGARNVYVPREQVPNVAAAPIAPVMSEALPNSMNSIVSGAPLTTTPDGPANAAPIYGSGMTDDPVTWNTPINNPRAPQNIMPAEAISLSPQAVAMPAPVTTTTMIPVSAPSSLYAVADGFGQDLPLVMALRQIVPPQYGFVFDNGVDVSTHVSWQGGRPWDSVLRDTIAPLGLSAAINGNVVSITRAGAPATILPGAMVTTETMQTASSMTMTPAPMVTPAAPAMMTQVAMTTPALAAPIVEPDMGGNIVKQASLNTGGDLSSASTWTAPRNSTLRSILEDWSKRIGVELYWASEYDYPIQSAVSVDGTFEQAVQTLLKGLSDSRPRPMGHLHPNLPNGPAVLVIETRQNSM